MDGVLNRIEEIQKLNKYEDINHPEKLDLYRNLVDFLKQNEKTILTIQNVSNLNNVVSFLVNELNKVTGKDIIRKLIMKCINVLTKSKSINLEQLVKTNLTRFLNASDQTVGQKLFILNLYLENIDIGVTCLTSLRQECLELITNWLHHQQSELEQSSAPIVIAKLVQDIQLLFKTLINFFQKCFNSKLNPESYEKYSFNLKRIVSSIELLLDKKDNFNMEVAYSASMAQILISSLSSEKNNLRSLIENCLEKYINSTYSIELRDFCFMQAILTMTKAPQIHEENIIDLFEKMVMTILKSPNESNNVSQAIALTRTLNFWIIKLLEILNFNRDSFFEMTNSEGFDWFGKLVIFSWSNFDCNIDVVRNTNLQNYKMLLKVAKKIKQDSADTFYEDEIKKCMKTSWQSNAKLNALIILIENGLSASKIYKLNANIAEDLLSAINERSTACLVADLYSNLFKLHRDEILSSQKANSFSLDEWALIWWSPVLKCLESDEKLKKIYTYEYLIPRMMRLCPDGILHCQKISKSYASKIICTKVSRSLCVTQNEALDSQVLENALVHFDDQIRLDSFGLICETQKTTELILNSEFDLVKKFLNFNSDSLSPSFRQVVIAHLKKLFCRFREGWLFQSKQFNKIKSLIVANENSFEIIDFTYKQFINWLFEFLFNSIHLDSTFAKRNQCLTIMSTFLEIVGSKCIDDLENVLFDFNEIFDRKRLLTLIECLWDTYVNNKELTLQLLNKLDRQIFEINEISIKEYFRISLNLLSSRRPIDSMTSVYLMMLIRNKADLKDFDLKDDSSKSLSLYLVKSYLEELKLHLAMASVNLLLAALNKPIYGPLGAIRNLITYSRNEIKNDIFITEWSQIITILIDICFKISKIVSPIVNSSSPEGIFPKELTVAQSDSGDFSSDQIKSVTPQMLLVCCWRTVKEVSLFFGDIIGSLPLEFESDLYVLSYKQVTRIGEYFVNLLFEARHLGVFEQTYAGFTIMCDTFWKSNSKIYCEQPTKWLKHILSAIQEEEFKSKLCSTRRGGGLPCFVQAIVSTELNDYGRKSLKTSFKVLIDLAEQNYEQDEKNFSKVLAMYILSALFKDTRIGECVLEYAERALITAVNGFDSVFWNVRNASTLLFSSLINRVFGVNRSKVEISKKNSMPGRIFFTKFPLLYQFFAKVISDSIVSINTHLNAKLYLVVLILGHLFTLSDELADPEALLHNYVPNLLECAKSPVMKTRNFIAKAIITIVNLDRYPTLIDDIFTLLLDRTEIIDHNKINGLLQILNGLIDKYDLFKFIPISVFLNNLEQLTSDKFDHCIVNYTLLLNLMSKVLRVDSKNTPLGNLTLKIELKSVNSIQICKYQVLNLPGTQDLLVAIGEILGILIVNLRMTKTENLIPQIVDLNNTPQEYSLYLMKGVSNFYNKCFLRDENENEFNCTEIFDVFMKKAFNSIFDWKSVNNIHDLKSSCELLVTFFKQTTNDDKKINQLIPNHKMLVDLWKNLIDCAQNQIESETSISVLDLITHIFKQVYKCAIFDELYFDRFLEVLTSYLDHSDEALTLSEFFHVNHHILFTALNKLGNRAIDLWDLLIQLLLDLDQEACYLTCEIISKLIANMEPGLDQEEYKKTPLAMINPTLKLFVRTYNETYPMETFQFLIEQFVLVCECDSNPNTQDEELEIVFDKGVDSIHSSQLIYLKELVECLLVVLKENSESQITACLNQNYQILCDRLDKELIVSGSNLNRFNMKYNDVRYSKIASHLMFIKKFENFANNENKLRLESILKTLKNDFVHFNSFLKFNLL